MSMGHKLCLLTFLLYSWYFSKKLEPHTVPFVAYPSSFVEQRVDRVLGAGEKDAPFTHSKIKINSP